MVDLTRPSNGGRGTAPRLVVVAFVASIFVIGYLRRKLRSLREDQRLTMLELARGGLDVAVANQVAEGEKRPVEFSDNFHNGTTENAGQCPCERHWTFESHVERFNQKPTPQQREDCLDAVSEPGAPSRDCAGECEWVVTDQWKDWSLWKHAEEAQWQLHCYWVKQWHCALGIEA